MYEINTSICPCGHNIFYEAIFRRYFIYNEHLCLLIEQVEEKELDTAKVSKAMTEINASQKAAREAQRQR